MESYIIGLFSEQLSTYIHGFKREQVNASLLSGKGEISQVQIKVEPINEILEDIIPSVKLASVYVSKLSFNVTSIRNIRKSPIEVTIDEVHVVFVERLKYKGKSDEQWIETAKTFIEEAKKKSKSYGLIDRIRDNITIDINRMYITFQPMGKFKTRKIGPWTPPAINIVLNNIRIVTVDEYGEEGSPNDVWRHNSRKGKQESKIRNRIKKKDVNSDQGKNSRKGSTAGKRIFEPKTHMIFKKCSFDVSIGLGRRTKGMGAKESFLKSHLLVANLPVQCHATTHIRLRDNALLAVQVDSSLTNIELVIESESLPLIVHALVGLQYCFIKNRSFVDPLNDGEADESLLLLNDVIPSYNIDGTDNNTNNEEKMGFDEESNHFNLESDDDDEEEDDNEEEGIDDMNDDNNDAAVPLPQSNEKSTSDDRNWPAFVLPSGIIIVEKLCCSLSIHRLSVRTKYHSSANGYLQLTMKGLISEFIWPKADGEMGGYVQLSLSHFNFHETYNQTIRTIINGGSRIDSNMYEGKETTNDETFPSMEIKDVRTDPFDLRTSFPVQAFGFKASIDLLDEDKILTSSSRTFVLHEIGMNSITLLAYPEIFNRATELFWTHSKPEFDVRWFSGEWVDEFPNIDFQHNIQLLPESITRELKLSSENVNVTMKVSDFKFKLPAIITSDLKKRSDVLIELAEITIVMSSALPRCFLSDEIFESDRNNSDIIPESNSNIRIQTTINGFSIEAIPSLYQNRKESQQILHSKAMTFLGSYDRVINSNGNNDYFLFLSTLLHYVHINLDFDILDGASNTLLHYVKIYGKIFEIQQSEKQKLSILSNLPELLTVMVRVDVSRIDCRLWQQHIPISEADAIATQTIIPLFHCDTEMIEFGIKMNSLQLSNVSDTFGSKISFDNFDVVAARLGKLRLSTLETVASNKSGFSFPSKASKDVELLCIESSDSTCSENNHKTLEFRIKRFNGANHAYFILVNLKSCTTRLGTELENSLVMIYQAIPGLKSTFLSNESEHTYSSKSNVGIDSLPLKIPSYLNKKTMDSLILHINAEDIFVDVPLYDSDQSIWVICQKAKICVGSLFGDVKKDYDNLWFKSFRDSAKGTHLSINSSQKVSLCRRDELQKNLLMEAPSLLESHTLNIYINPLYVDCSLGEIKVSSKDLVTLQLLYDNLNQYRERLLKLQALVHKTFFKNDNKTMRIPDNCKVYLNEPIATACAISTLSIENAATSLTELHLSLSSLKESIANDFDSKDAELRVTRSELFTKEIDRFSAFALLSSDASGYIRMGSASFSHQRIVSTTNFWRYFLVLKKQNLILYSNPSSATPVDHFSLLNAKLLALKGGAKKRDLQKGFAIIDSNGTKRFFITETYSQYEKWVSAINKTISKQDQSSSQDVGLDNLQESISEHAHSTKESNTEFKTDSRSVPDIQDSFSQDHSMNHEFNETNDGNKLKLREKAKNRMLQFGSAVKKNKNAIKQRIATIDTNGIEMNDELGFDNDSVQDSKTLFPEEVLDNEETKDIIDSKKMKLREKAKHSMAKIKSNIDKNAIKQFNAGSMPKMSMRPKNNHNLLQDQPSLRIRGLNTSGEAPLVKEKIIHSDQEMLTMQGTWIATVTSSEKEIKSEDNTTSEVHFFIYVQCEQLLDSGVEKPHDVSVTKDFSDLMMFHAEISDALVSMRNNLPASGLIVADNIELLFAEISHCGRLLKGFLNYYKKDSCLDPLCDAFNNFLNVLLGSALPTVTIEATKTFLCLENEKSNQLSRSSLYTLAKDVALDHEHEIIHLMTLIEESRGALAQAKRQTEIINALAIDSSFIPDEFLKPHKVSTFSPSDPNRIALYETLAAVMVERDEAQSQLMAERVFHTHELDQEQRKVDMLEKKIEYYKKVLNEGTASAASFFLGQEEVPNKNSLGKIEQTMIQNVDAELMELCRQLSSEISTRVSSELEVLRLKESRRIEREMEYIERKTRDNEMNDYNKQLQEIETEKDDALKEAAKWKQAFEKLVAIDSQRDKQIDFKLV